MISSEDYYETQRLREREEDDLAQQRYENWYTEIFMLFADGFAGRHTTMLPCVVNKEIKYISFPEAVYEVLEYDYVFSRMLSGDRVSFEYACADQYVKLHCNALAEVGEE